MAIPDNNRNLLPILSTSSMTNVVSKNLSTPRMTVVASRLEDVADPNTSAKIIGAKLRTFMCPHNCCEQARKSAMVTCLQYTDNDSLVPRPECARESAMGFNDTSLFPPVPSCPRPSSLVGSGPNSSPPTPMTASWTGSAKSDAESSIGASLMPPSPPARIRAKTALASSARPFSASQQGLSGRFLINANWTKAMMPDRPNMILQPAS